MTSIDMHFTDTTTHDTLLRFQGHTTYYILHTTAVTVKKKHTLHTKSIHQH